MTISIAGAVGRATRRLDRLSDRQYALVSFLPGGLLVFLVVLPPTLVVLGMSFFRIELLKDDLTPFVGIRNYLRIAEDQALIDSIPRSVIFAAAVTAITIPLALATALIMNRTFRGVGLIGVALLLPWAIAPVVTGVYWKFIFQAQFGLATGLMNALGLADSSIGWLENTGTAVGIAVLATAWKAIPLLAVLLLGALKTIPESQFRAAKMDGAGVWQSFRWITIPGIGAMLVAVTVLQIIGALQSFDVLFTLTQGGPGQDTTLIVYYIFVSAFRFLSFGYSAALSVLLAVIIVIASASLLYVRQRRTTAAVSSAEDDAAPLRLTRSLSAVEPVKRSVPSEMPGKRRRSVQVPLLRGLTALLAICIVTFLVGPIAWLALASIQPEYAVTQTPPALVPTIDLRGYASLVQRQEWVDSLWVSLQLTLITTAITLILGSMAAYPLARLDIPFKRGMIAVLIGSQMVPAVVIAIPILLMFQAVALKDTVLSLVIVNTAFWLPLITWLLKNVFDSVPRSIESAARIDGCSRLGTLFRITMPAAAPGIASLAILLIIGTWNEFLFAVILGDREAVTITRRIGYIETLGGIGGSAPYTLQASAAVVAALPCIALVIVFHRRIVRGLTEGFLRGAG